MFRALFPLLLLAGLYLIVTSSTQTPSHLVKWSHLHNLYSFALIYFSIFLFSAYHLIVDDISLCSSSTLP